MSIRAQLGRLEIQRAGIGLLQGGLLLLLVRFANTGTWPESLNLLHAPLLMAALFLPIVAISALGKLARRDLMLWLAVVAALITALGVYDVYRRTGAPKDWDDFSWFFQLQCKGDLLPPSTSRTGFFALGLFIAQSLVLAGAADRRWIARYATYFDVSWMLGIQIALSVLFTGLFWGALELGAALFHMIGVDFFREMFKHDWFILPASAAAFSLALHVTDVKPDWVRGIRRLVLTLFAWLLPLLMLFAVGFLVALPIMGVDSLWRTRYAASLVLTVACCLIALINAAYMQGEMTPPAFLRWSGRAAAVALVPLVGLGFWAIWLRVAQYGQSSERIIALASVVVIACYAIGYLAAAVRRGPWLKWLEACNVTAAFVVLGVILALISPLADPARLSVANQLARLESGKVEAAAFDFKALRFDGERFGHAALARLKETQAGSDPTFIRQQAALVLDMKDRWGSLPMRTADRAANVTVYPTGKALDATFLDAEWQERDTQSWELPKCLVIAAQSCDAYVVNLDGVGSDEVVIPDDNTAWVFQQDKDGAWRRVGELTTELPCPAIMGALRRGDFSIVSPQPPQWRDIALTGGRLTVRPIHLRPVQGTSEESGCWP